MRTFTLAAMVALFTSVLALHAEDAPAALGVTIGGQKPKAVAGQAFTELADPVAADAEAVLDLQNTGFTMCNILPLDEKGEKQAGNQPDGSMLLQGTNKTALNKTQEGKALASGGYFMFVVVADGKQAQIRFKVK